ncbi:MAG: PKD-like domain-containing protein, partial [Candidatus Staskawiczbacteria bacterium]
TVLSGPVAGTIFSWSNNNIAIGLGASGTGNIPSFTATNSSGTAATAVVTVIPSFNGCSGTPTSYTITVNPTPTVNPLNNQNLCNGALSAAINFSGSVTGTVYSWTNSNTAIGLGASGTGNIGSFTAINTGTTPLTATITVTPSFSNGGLVCTGNPVIFTILVNPVPAVTPVNSQLYCSGATAPATPLTGPVSGTLYSWTNSNTGIGLGASGTGNIPGFTATNTGPGPIVAQIIITPTANGCAGIASGYTITVNPAPAVETVNSQVVCHNSPTAAINFNGPVTGTVFNWTNSAPSIGLAAGGSGNIASFVAVNTGSQAITATITATPSYTGSGLTCTGAPVSFTIVVNPLPAAAGTISGPVSVQQGQTGVAYTMPAIAGATGYSWTLPTGTTIVSGANTNSIIVDFSRTAISGIIHVVGTNPCGEGLVSPDLSITVAPFIPVNYEVQNLIIGNGQTVCYNASQTITVAGNGTLFLVLYGGSATFIAGEKIRFLPGTTVFSGGYLLGQITTTGQYCIPQNQPVIGVVKAEASEPVPAVVTPNPKVYPNPTTGLFTLDLSHVDLTSSTVFEIYRMTGEVVASETITSEAQHVFNLDRQPAGIYLLRAINLDKAWTIKIIKE